MRFVSAMGKVEAHGIEAGADHGIEDRRFA
jgi:hypothetical protein